MDQATKAYCEPRGGNLNCPPRRRARACLTEFDPQLVLLDIGMPKLRVKPVDPETLAHLVAKLSATGVSDNVKSPGCHGPGYDYGGLHQQHDVPEASTP